MNANDVLSKAQRDAACIIAGASNPLGICRSLHELMLEYREVLNRTGQYSTSDLKKPAFRLIAFQLLYLLGATDVEYSLFHNDNMEVTDTPPKPLTDEQVLIRLSRSGPLGFDSLNTTREILHKLVAEGLIEDSGLFNLTDRGKELADQVFVMERINDMLENPRFYGFVLQTYSTGQERMLLNEQFFSRNPDWLASYTVLRNNLLAVRQGLTTIDIVPLYRSK